MKKLLLSCAALLSWGVTQSQIYFFEDFNYGDISP